MADQKTPNDFDAEIERQVAAEVERDLAVEMAKKRAELARQARRRIEMEHLDKANAKHPIEDRFGGLGPEGYAERLRQMDARAKADNAAMDAANARPASGAVNRGPKMQIPGAEGFTVNGLKVR